MASSIVDLRPGTSGHNLVVKVLEAKVVVDRPKTNKSEGTKIAECMVADKTGCIVFSARNEQVAKAQPGTFVSLQGARVDMYRSSMRIVVDKGQGSVEEAEGQSFAPNASMNMSLVEFEWIPTTSEH